MKKKLKVLCVILARVGSKGIFQKNIKELCGHPLISYSIYAARKSKLINRVVVSTDSMKIKKISENYGAEVPFLRPKKLALDHIWSRDALKHAVLKSEEIYNEKYDYIVELPAVAPLRNCKHVDEAITKLVSNKKADSVISISRVFDKHPVRIKKIISGKIADYNKTLKEGESSRRQDLPDAYVRNGAIYAMKRKTIVKDFSRKGKISLPYVMNEFESVNIDELSDFYLTEVLIKKGYCKNFPSILYIDKKIDIIKKAKKNILVTYNKKISKSVFKDFKLQNHGIIFSSAKNLENIRNKETIIAWLVSTDGEILIDEKITSKFKNLKYIFSPSTGLTHIDTKNLNKNITIINLNNLNKTKKIFASSEFAIALILYSIRNMELLSHTVHSNNWRNKEDQLRGYELSNFNFGIFGFGRIGKNISKFLKIFTNKIHYYDPNVSSKDIKKISNLNNFLKKTDYLIISSKLNEKTKNFFNKAKLKLLRKNSFLLNISRGEIIVEKDLINLIKNNHFKKVIIDVVSNEDKILNGENEIVKFSRLKNNLIITPHIAGLTYNSEYKALNKMKQLIYKYLK